MNSRLGASLMALCVFGLDRLSKTWVQQRLSAWDVWTVIPGFFNIVRSENRGMAFSLLADAPEGVRLILLVGLSGFLLCLVVYMLWHAQQRLQRLALLLILGGALGNLYDRILRGSVTDFLDFHIGDYHWATFNIADSAITVGAILMAAELWMSRKAPHGERPQGKVAS
jgi:signal peptidase II